jgi:SAM-dependent methyltransferase
LAAPASLGVSALGGHIYHEGRIRMSDSQFRVLGTAAQVVELFGDKVSITSMYDTAGARLYHGLTRQESAEIEELLTAAEGVRGPVLELACGTGRITVPFLKKGYEVFGLDFSPSMLELLGQRLQEDDAAGLSDRLETTQGDMTDFSLGRKFPLVILGASAVWNVDAEQRAGLFSSVREHLTDDGRFLFTLIEFPTLDEDATPFETQITYASLQEGAKALITFFDFVDPAAELRSTNILAQAVVDGAVAGQEIYTALTHLVSPSALEKEIEAAGLKVAGRTEVTSGYEILKASARPVTVQLVEVTR